MSEPLVIVALDVANREDALRLARRLHPSLCRLKVGKELFVAAGPQLVEELVQLGFDVFLDLKFHDIPHTVAQACRVAAGLGVWMVNVHAMGGPVMLEAAREALANVQQRPLLIGVTVLTSMDAPQLQAIGLDVSPAEQVLRLAALVKEHGLDGVVCSAQEAPLLRARLDAPFRLVTPGIRPASASRDDQVRTATPEWALANGVDYLVIGRPITGAADPLQALTAINESVGVHGAGDRP